MRIQPTQSASRLPCSPCLQPESFEFSIRTPVTPARWDDYDEVGAVPWSTCVSIGRLLAFFSID